jgi:hypothetical protein
MHKNQQRTYFLWIIQGTTFIQPKEESPKIPTMQKKIEHSLQKKGTNQSLNFNKTYIKWVYHFLFLIWAPNMCFLWARAEEQFQFYLEFLSPNVIVLRNFNLQWH